MKSSVPPYRDGGMLMNGGATSAILMRGPLEHLTVGGAIRCVLAVLYKDAAERRGVGAPILVRTLSLRRRLAGASVSSRPPSRTPPRDARSCAPRARAAARSH